MFNKKDRRKARHEKNIKKELNYKKNAWNSGKLIEENHNGQNYSIEYTEQLSNKLIEYLNQEYYKSINSEDPIKNYIIGFRKYKNKIRDLIILWNPNYPENYNYKYLKGLLEIYWDEVLQNSNPSSLLKYSSNGK